MLTGRSADHIETLPSGEKIHRQMRTALEKLRGDAAKEGFDLQVTSGFRDYASQLRIWNGKARGERKLLDAAGNPVEFASLSPGQLVHAIMRWSALPGASRHHWGTEIDVYDRRALPQGYQVQLTPQEVDPGGMFAPLHEWLDRHIEGYGFFRPYAKDLGGVSPERWHLSYAPISQNCFKQYPFEVFENNLRPAEIELKDELLRNARAIYDKYFTAISGPTRLIG